MGNKNKTVIEQLREAVAKLKLEEAAGKDIELIIVGTEEELKSLSETISKLNGELGTSNTRIVTLTGEKDSALADLETARAEIATLTSEKDSALTELETERAKVTALTGEKDASEAKAREAQKMLNEAAEQLENRVSTKKGVSKTKVKEANVEYMVNPLRKFTGVPGHGDKVFTGQDVITNLVKVTHEGKEISLRSYLVATGASIMELSNGRK